MQNIFPPSTFRNDTRLDPSPPKSQNLIYSLDIKNNTPAIRKVLCKKFSDQLKKDGLGQSIQLSQDKVLKDLLRVKIEDRQYLPILKKILSHLESSLHTNIKLTEWRS